jgi:hypothetical protein
VVAGISDAFVAALGTRLTGSVRISEGRYALDLPLDPPPDQLLRDLTSAGAHLVSLNPIRQTLEDFFVQQVSTPAATAAQQETGDRVGAAPGTA